MNGIILMDKLQGMSSAQFLNQVKKILGVSKAGHTGTLDPFATGLMTVCINKATKIIPFLNEDMKEYRAVMKFGEVTDTMDCTGKVIKRVDAYELDTEAVFNVLEKYQGYIEQTPPDYSAVKVNGTRLYKLARKGVQVEKPNRTVFIEKLSVIECSMPFLTISIRCSRGTYVRSVADSIGKELGVGAHLTDLRRIKSGKFEIGSCYTLTDLENGNFHLIDLNESLSDIKVLNVDNRTASSLKNGNNIKKYMLPDFDMADINIGDKFRIVANNELIGIVVSLVSYDELRAGYSNEDILKIKKILH